MINEKNEGQVGKKQVAKSKMCFDGIVCSNSGRSIAPVYKRVYDKELNKLIVKKVDETNITEFIQASKNTTDLAILQKRFIELGEIPQVDPNVGSNDLAVFPDNIHEVYKMVNDVEANFNKLPESIKNVFGTKEAYMQALLNGSYQATLINALNAKQSVKEEKQEDKKEGNE